MHVVNAYTPPPPPPPPYACGTAPYLWNVEYSSVLPVHYSTVHYCTIQYCSMDSGLVHLLFPMPLGQGYDDASVRGIIELTWLSLQRREAWRKYCNIVVDSCLVHLLSSGVPWPDTARHHRRSHGCHCGGGRPGGAQRGEGGRTGEGGGGVRKGRSEERGGKGREGGECSEEGQGGTQTLGMETIGT